MINANFKNWIILPIIFPTFLFFACSVGPVSSLDEDEISFFTSSSNVASSGSNISSSMVDFSSSSVEKDTAVENKEITIEEPLIDSVNVARATDNQLKAPEISAVIFQWDTTIAVYEFDLVVTGNYSTYAIMEAENIDTLVYEFKLNNQSPEEWKTVKISKLELDGPNSVTYVNDIKYTLNGLSELCHSYATARIIWTDSNTGEQKYTEWANPVGPLYDLASTGKTKFASGLGGNPCE